MIGMICTINVIKEDDVYIAKDVNTSVASEGRTVEEAISNLKEALELFYEDTELSPEEEFAPILTTTLEVKV